MDAPAEDKNTQNQNPTLEELKQELSDADLENRGILFSAKYLLFKIIMANGFDDFSKKIRFDDVRQQLKQLFPQQQGERLPDYLQYNSDAFNVAFEWARAKAYEEWRVSKLAASLKKDSPDATDEQVEADARSRTESADTLKEVRAAVIKASKDLGIPE